MYDNNDHDERDPHTGPDYPGRSGNPGSSRDSIADRGTSSGGHHPPCPDKEVLTGSWDSREVGYASNHDVREAGVWEDKDPVPVTLTQKCWDVSGTYMRGGCQGTLNGKIEKNVYAGKYSETCTTEADSSAGTFFVTMAADNQSFMGAMYQTGGYGPEAGFPPSWWAKKTA
ncbi:MULTISPECIES: hypothetical protein [unclassified Methanoregula]|uniref:hypothetical protein n=1 Tax=unclassified Methanoregula TaxID=2649730 RepID=UPI0009CE4C7E|nr:MULTISPECIES: hypothetical protein [unclassified Methanoregula]OPX64289.1 MAG: hypothetical protein A4E33_01318 [Methanoregula sp. PtaB.Bin085]OPY33586.1 MAG: hypothetical protein A4E34_01909 [Methanoregula sp. PtaU1.Bin006]